jgi:hypothetical protein
MNPSQDRCQAIYQGQQPIIEYPHNNHKQHLEALVLNKRVN